MKDATSMNLRIVCSRPKTQHLEKCLAHNRIQSNLLNECVNKWMDVPFKECCSPSSSIRILSIRTKSIRMSIRMSIRTFYESLATALADLQHLLKEVQVRDQE